MKQFKRIFALLLAVVMLFSLASCSLVNASETDITTDNIKIGIILADTKDSQTGTSGIINAMTNQLTGLGYGIKDERFKRMESVDPADSAAVADALKSLVNFECSMVIVSDPRMEAETLKAAETAPSTAFFVFKGQGNGKNVFSYNANITAASYLAGITAGLKAASLKVPKLGYILNNEKDCTTINAFFKGAKSVNPQITLSAVTAGEDIAAGAQKLIKEGCVVLASDIQSEEIAKAATEANIFFCDFGTAAFNNEDYKAAYLCAPLYDFTQYFVDTIKVIADFEVPEDNQTASTIELVTAQGLLKDYDGGFATGATYLSDINTANAAEGTVESIKAVSETLASGALKFELSASKLEAGITLAK